MNKTELLALVKELSELESLTGREADVSLVKREFKRVANYEAESYAEQEMIDAITKYYDVLATKATSLNASTYDEKKALVAKAKALVGATSKKANDEMNQIFQDFKQAGRCSKEQDDELWAEMKAARDEFYAKKKEHYEGVAQKMAEAKATKEAIIEEAKEVLNMNNMKDANNKMNELMERWKQAGFAAKADNDALWETFSAVRGEFFTKRKTFNEEMKATYAERVAAKEALIKKAHIALANSTFTKEEVEGVKTLRTEWKAVGFAGKEVDDRLWNEFQETVNKYFQELKSYKD